MLISKFAFLFALLGVVCSCTGYKGLADHELAVSVSHKIMAIARKMANVNRLDGPAVGFAEARTRQWDNFVELKKKATIEELLLLTNHENAVVRCYAFWATLFDPAVDPWPTVVAHIEDTKEVTTFFGCLPGKEKVGDFYISLVMPNDVDTAMAKLDSAQLATLDSILLAVPNNLYARDRAEQRRGKR